MPYLTVGELERELPFDERSFGLDGATWANLLTDVRARVEDQVEQWTDAPFEARTASETLHGSRADGDALPLPRRPVISVQSVVADGESLDLTTDVEVTETHIELRDAAPIDRWPRGRYNVAVEWTYGFQEVPGPVEDAIIRLVRNALDNIETDGLQSESEDQISYTYRTPASVKAEARAQVQQYAAPSYGSGVYMS